jgi:hypothetical protein
MVQPQHSLSVLQLATEHPGVGPRKQIVSAIAAVDAHFGGPLDHWFFAYGLHITPNRLTNRSSQPPAVPMPSFHMTSTRTLQFALAAASGG